MSHVLFIEPHRGLGNTYKQALEAAGYSVAVSHHAQDAVHAADTARPDVVVLELQLSGHSGLEFLHEFRSYSEWQNIPVILLTMVPPSSLKITKEIMAQFGMVDVLYKPATTLQKLRRAVDIATLVTT